MTYLLKKGNLVFKTIHDTGCVDIVALDKNGKIHLYDVKTCARYHNGPKKGRKINRVLTPLQKKLNVELLMVDLEEERCWIINHGGREKSMESIKKEHKINNLDKD